MWHRPRFCVYCGCMVHVRHEGPNQPDEITTDHLLAWKRMSPGQRSDRTFGLLNEVICCRECNRRKGSDPPLNWLLDCPDIGAEWLARRIVRLGLHTRAEVDLVLKQRLTIKVG